VIDSRSANLSFVHTDGLDFKLDYETELPIGTLHTGVDGTYIFNLREKVAPATPIASILNTQYNPVDLKLRAQGILRHGNFDFGVFVNYVDSYHDNRSVPATPISSWLTFDLSADYRFDAEAASYLRETAVTLSVTNVADTNPPFVASPQPVLTPGLTFDGANANVWGRVISLQLTKQW
jgi:iron complex outermembrane receptor protein